MCASESVASMAIGTPARSATALARNTAGVQLPQQAIPEMTASHFFARRAAMIPSKPVLSNRAVTPIFFAM